jgi:hypothetical protein
MRRDILSYILPFGQMIWTGYSSPITLPACLFLIFTQLSAWCPLPRPPSASPNRNVLARRARVF